MGDNPIEKKNVLTKPSFYAQAISGIIIAYAIYLYLTIERLSQWENLIGLIGIGIAIGIHGLAHLQMEVHYDFNPFQYIF